MQQVTDLHRKAMDLASEAQLERIHGHPGRAHDLICEAFQHEREAACLVKDQVELEPTRSVLYRSAGSLALECSDFREAERLIASGLAGNPPEEIAEELRELLEQVSFERHLSLRGMILRPDEFQFSMSGSAIGSGFAQSDEFTGRAQNLQKLVYRTAARVMKLPYREHGPADGKVRREIEVYLSVPRAACFAVSFRLGELEQLKLSGFSLGKDVIDEVFDCLDLLNTSSHRALRERIPEQAYYTNFVGLAHSIRPDGSKVKFVGLTAFRQEKERRIVLSDQREPAEEIGPHDETTQGQTVEIKGILLVADAHRESKQYIMVVDADQRQHRVRVPTGMMGDIVRPLFEYEVVVRGKQAGKYLLLEDIRKAE